MVGTTKRSIALKESLQGAARRRTPSADFGDSRTVTLDLGIFQKVQIAPMCKRLAQPALHDSLLLLCR